VPRCRFASWLIMKGASLRSVAPIEATIVRLKREYPGWGAPKIRSKALVVLRL